MTISNTQLQQLAALDVRKFIRKMGTYARENYPVFCSYWEAAELRSYIDQVIGEGMTLGFEDEAHAEHFLDLHLNYPAMRQRPLLAWIHEALTYPDRTPERKLEALKFNLAFPAA